MSDEFKFDIWMRDPDRWEIPDGPYVGYCLHYANQSIADVTETLLLTAHWDVAVVTAGKQPFVKRADGTWEKSDDLHMIAQCLRPLKILPGGPKSLAELFGRANEE